MSSEYIGRIAPTPTGFLHLGHAATFRTAWERAREQNGKVLLRIEDLDPARCKPEFTSAILDDLLWIGIDWDSGPEFQSMRRPLYLRAWKTLKEAGLIYPCTKTRKDLRNVALAPHEDEETAEPLYPTEWRPAPSAADQYETPGGVAWRFRVPENEPINFSDRRKGACRFTSGSDFGDFVVWRRDDVPAYELAVVVDDIAQGITEVVRGEDLLRSTARQLLLYRALGEASPGWYHTELIRDASGRRLAKRHQALTMKSIREAGTCYEDVRLK